MAVSEDMPCVASMLSNSVLNKQQGGHQSHKTKVHMYKIISATSSPLVVIEAVFFFFTEICNIILREGHITHINTVLSALLLRQGE